jgi:hypothetical protein
MRYRYVIKSDHVVAETGETQTRTVETGDPNELANQIRGLVVDNIGQEVTLHITATERPDDEA